MEDLQWHEPAAYRRAVARRQQRENPWKAVGFAGAAFLVVIALRALAAPNPNQIGWPATVVLAATLALFLAFGFPRLILLFPNSIVILSRKGINNNVVGNGASIRFWSWDKISSCRVSTASHEGREFRTLTIYGPDGREAATFGLRDAPTIDAIRRLLERHGKSLEVDDT